MSCIPIQKFHGVSSASAADELWCWDQHHCVKYIQCEAVLERIRPLSTLTGSGFPGLLAELFHIPVCLILLKLEMLGTGCCAWAIASPQKIATHSSQFCPQCATINPGQSCFSHTQALGRPEKLMAQMQTTSTQHDLLCVLTVSLLQLSKAGIRTDVSLSNHPWAERGVSSVLLFMSLERSFLQGSVPGQRNSHEGWGELDWWSDVAPALPFAHVAPLGGRWKNTVCLLCTSFRLRTPDMTSRFC